MKNKEIFCLIVFLVAMMISCSDPGNPAEHLGLKAIFFAINDSEIRSVNADDFEQSILEFSSVNLGGSADFWINHSNYFMHALGSIEFPDNDEYQFKLISSGRVILKLNNKELFAIRQLSKDAENSSSMHLPKGKNLLEIEYYDGGIDPKLILMWSRDGKEFSIIPPENYFKADLTGGGSVTDKGEGETFMIQPDNTLNPAELDEGWRLLFDGRSTKGWHTYNHPGTIGNKWKVEEGTLMFEGRDRFRYMFEGRQMEMGPTDKKGDGGIGIVMDEDFENFELKLEWKISYGGNNGIFFTVLEDERYPEIWNTSPEMQILHDDIHKDGLIETHRAGDLYDLIACSEVTVKPQGQWNQVKIIKNQGQVEQWLNGVKVVEYDLNSDEWKDMISKSKFAHLDDYGTAERGKIGFQDHDNPAWFKNIKIRELK